MGICFSRYVILIHASLGEMDKSVAEKLIPLSRTNVEGHSGSHKSNVIDLKTSSSVDR